MPETLCVPAKRIATVLAVALSAALCLLPFIVSNMQCALNPTEDAAAPTPHGHAARQLLDVSGGAESRLPRHGGAGGARWGYLFLSPPVNLCLALLLVATGNSKQRRGGPADGQPPGVGKGAIGSTQRAAKACNITI